MCDFFFNAVSSVLQFDWDETSLCLHFYLGTTSFLLFKVKHSDFFKKKNTGQNICLVYHKLCPAIHAVNTHKYYFLAVTSGAIEEGQLLPNALKVYINVC